MAVKTTKKYPVYGETGADVVKYQKLLAKSGSTIKPTGRFTIGMMSALKAFQKRTGLKVTGIIDAKTAAALEALKAVRKK